MGEVYRATDTKLEREVAIKVLPAVFAQDKERLARFEREAKVLAQLNHPNIASVYGFDQDGETWFLVMEHVDGEDLSHRLKRSPLPVDEAIEIGTQVAEGLEAAHANGIIHRDLKPANIKLDSEGRVKVLDFGLAKATVESAVSSELEQIPGVDSDSPTITADFTRPGTILGTAAYMAPEQTKGSALDRRADVWAFGCVLFECLTGQRAFPGSDVGDILAGILKDEPAWNALPETTPIAVRLLLRKCLKKDRKRRLLDMGDARIDLEEAVGDPTSSFSQSIAKGPSPSTFRTPVWAGVCLAMLLLGGFVTWGVFQFDQPPSESPVRRLEVNLGLDGPLNLIGDPAVRLSPDGSMMAYIEVLFTGARGKHQLHVRRFDQLNGIAIPGTGHVNDFCFSANGEWIAFVQEGTLRKASVSGQRSQVVAKADSVSGICWGADGYIVMGSSEGGLRRVLDSGGILEPLTELGSKDVNHTSPYVTPDGSTVLYTAIQDSGPVVMAKSIPSGSPQLLVENAMSPTALASGQLIYVSEQQLMAAPLDLKALKITGASSVVMENVVAEVEGRSVGHFDLSENGMLAYLPGPFELPRFRIEWVDRAGTRTEVLPEDQYLSISLSPDGNSLLYGLNTEETNEMKETDVWMADLVHGGRFAMAAQEGKEWKPIWSPFGESFVYSRERNGSVDLYWRPIDRTGISKLLLETETLVGVWSWHPSGNFISFLEADYRQKGTKIQIGRMVGNDQAGWKLGPIETFKGGNQLNWSASFSPDGNWLAYLTTEHGGHRIYVTGFPGGDREYLVSGDLEGVDYPIWAKESKELFFAKGATWGIDEQQIYSVKWRVEEGKFIPEAPVPWIGATTTGIHMAKDFQIHPDGNRVLVRTKSDDRSGHHFDHVVLVENFDKYLQTLERASD